MATPILLTCVFRSRDLTSTPKTYVTFAIVPCSFWPTLFMFQGKGQTVLHFAKSYTFDDLFVLLKGKVVAFSFLLSCSSLHPFAQGADDTIKNSDGLTCYEGSMKLFFFAFFKPSPLRFVF